MATPIGTNVVTSLARHNIMPQIVDAIYASNPVTFRLVRSGKKIIQGGTQIESPVIYKRFTNGGPYQGYDVLNIVPNDTVKNMAWDWKQQYVPVTIDGLTLIKTDSPLAIANFIKTYFTQAEMEGIENLATGIWSDAVTNAKQIDGLKGAVDAGSVTTTYAGLTRSTNTWMNAQVDGSTATLTASALQSHFMNVKSGGRAPSLIASRVEQYVRYLNLGSTTQLLPQTSLSPGGQSEILQQAGFTNAVFNNVPWVEDSHVFDGPNTSNSAIVTLNEDYLNLVVSPRADMYLQDFQKPIDQDVMVSMILWAGNLICLLPSRQGKMTALTA